MQQKKSKFVTVKAYRFYLLKNVVSLDLVTLQHWFSDMKNTHMPSTLMYLMKHYPEPIFISS